MSFLDMTSEMTGSIPKMPLDLARTFINRAWRDVRRKNLWSFQLFEANWVSPSLVNAGMAITTQGANTVTFDATASAAISAIALLGPIPTNLTSRQFRVGISTIYNIWKCDVGGGGIVTLTLDRPYTDPPSTGSPYTIFQCYYAAPMKDFLTWINIRDITNFNDLDLTLTRQEIDFRDPQRTIYYLPTAAVAYQLDQNVNGPTYQWPMFELWGQPQYPIVYQLYGIRKGMDLQNDTDELPPAVGEDCVMEMAKYYGYQWAEANKGDMPRNAGSDFKFLMGASSAQYKKLYSDYRRQDRETVDNWYEIRRHRSWLSNVDGYYNAIGGTANPGAPW